MNSDASNLHQAERIQYQ